MEPGSGRVRRHQRAGSCAADITARYVLAVGERPLEDGHAQVIAQGVVELGEGSYVWSDDELDPSSWPFTFGDLASTFVVADGDDAVLVTSEAGPLALLDAGEAAFVPAGTTGLVTPLFDGAYAEGRLVSIAAGAGPGAFAPGAGWCDVNLIRNVVGPEETLTVSSLYPVLVVVTDGELVDAAGSSVDLSTGAVTTMSGNLELRNDSEETATVLVAAIGSGVPTP